MKSIIFTLSVVIIVVLLITAVVVFLVCRSMTKAPAPEAKKDRDNADSRRKNARNVSVQVGKISVNDRCFIRRTGGDFSFSDNHGKED